MAQSSKLILAVGKSLFLTTQISPQDCLSVLLMWWPASFRVSDPRENKMESIFFMTLSQKSYNITCIVAQRVTQATLMQCERKVHSRNTRSEDRGPSWRLPPDPPLKSGNNHSSALCTTNTRRFTFPEPTRLCPVSSILVSSCLQDLLFSWSIFFPALLWYNLTKSFYI